jgi:hypothetical protein
MVGKWHATLLDHFHEKDVSLVDYQHGHGMTSGIPLTLELSPWLSLVLGECKVNAMGSIQDENVRTEIAQLLYMCWNLRFRQR